MGRLACMAGIALVLWVRSTAGDDKASYNYWARERIARLRDRLLVEPTNAVLHLNLGVALHADGRPEAAAEEVERALELCPDYPKAHYNLAVLLQEQGDMDGAMAHYEHALAGDSTLVAAQAGLGSLLCERGKARGMELLERTLIASPELTAARYNLGVAYLKAGDARRAVAHLDIVVQEHSGHGQARIALGRAHLARGIGLLVAGQPRQAAEQLDRAAAYVGSDPGLLYAWGVACEELGDPLGARRAYGRAVAQDSTHVPSLHSLARLLEEAGATSSAKRFYAQVIHLLPDVDTVTEARRLRFGAGCLAE